MPWTKCRRAGKLYEAKLLTGQLASNTQLLLWVNAQNQKSSPDAGTSAQACALHTVGWSGLQNSFHWT